MVELKNSSADFYSPSAREAQRAQPQDAAAKKCSLRLSSYASSLCVLDYFTIFDPVLFCVLRASSWLTACDRGEKRKKGKGKEKEKGDVSASRSEFAYDDDATTTIEHLPEEAHHSSAQLIGCLSHSYSYSILLSLDSIPF